MGNIIENILEDIKRSKDAVAAFQQGDTVRVVNDKSAYFNNVGVIEEIQPSRNLPISVKFSDRSGRTPFAPDELEKVEQA